jgi:CheY-like chemotaxis protein
MQEDKNRRILVVDDNRTIHDDFRKILAAHADDVALDRAEAEILGTPLPVVHASEAEVFDLDSAYQGQDAWEKVKASVASGERYAMAFVDMPMPPGWDGVETISKMWEADPDIQVVICTAYSDYSWEDIILNHVGLLYNRPSGEPGCLLFSRPTTCIHSHTSSGTYSPSHNSPP